MVLAGLVSVLMAGKAEVRKFLRSAQVSTEHTSAMRLHGTGPVWDSAWETIAASELSVHYSSQHRSAEQPYNNLKAIYAALS